MSNYYFSGVKEVISFKLYGIERKNPSRIWISTSKIKTEIKQILFYSSADMSACVQSSDWPARLSVCQNQARFKYRFYTVFNTSESSSL